MRPLVLMFVPLTAVNRRDSRWVRVDLIAEIRGRTAHAPPYNPIGSKVTLFGGVEVDVAESPPEVLAKIEDQFKKIPASAYDE